MQAARDEGFSDELLAELARVQALEMEKFLEEMMKRSETGGTLARELDAASSQRDFVRSSVTGVTMIQADRMVDVLQSVAIWTRQTAFNTSALTNGVQPPIGGVGGRFTGSGFGGGVNVTVNVQGGSDAQQTAGIIASEITRQLNIYLGEETRREQRFTGDPSLN